MAQSLNQKAVNNFVRGLITEAGELTFPDGASVDELNCDLRRDGSRRRRLGAVYEDSHVLSTFTIGDGEIVHTGNWVNVGGNADLEFLVVQKGVYLYFYDKSKLPYSGQQETNFINLSSYEQSGSNGAGSEKCQFASLKGNLIVSSSQINTVAIEYSSGTFTITQLEFKVRDFEWQGDTSEYYEDDSTPSQDRKYDAQNSGWNTGSPAPTDLTKRLTHPWYSGKDADGDYSETEFDKVYQGTTLTANGHYILDFFQKDRGTASGLTGLTKMTEVEGSRFRCVESFAGRVFYAGLDSSRNAGTILFSKLADSIDDLGICHQQNDPTGEDISDLLATDGGEIRIPDAVKIQKLYAYQNSLFVFAENGVWQITGLEGVFKADAYSVNRVSRVGILNPETFVAAEGAPFWWSYYGIHTLTTDPVSGQGGEQNLSLPTVQTLWDNIGNDEKLKVTAAYDSINKRIFWAYPDADETVESKLNNFLILDVPLQAFYPWKISDQSSNTDCVVGLSFFSGYGALDLELDVLANNSDDDVLTASGGTDVNAGSFVTDTVYIIETVGTTDFTAIGASANTVGVVFTATGAGSGTGVATEANDVVSTRFSTVTTGDSAIVLLYRDGATNKLTMGGFTGIGFLDWGDTNYTSFAETGYDFIGDLVTKKSAPYIVTYCRLTETGFTGTEQDGYEAVRPSSLTVAASWDYNKTFGTAQQVYRHKFPIVVDPNNIDNFPYPEEVITTRLQMRGTGRSVRLRYESEQGKDFNLLGWGIIQGRNPRF